MKTVCQHVSKKSKKPNSLCHHCSKPGFYKNSCRQPNKQYKQAADTKNSSGTKHHTTTNSYSNTISKNCKSNNKNDKKLRIVYFSCEKCGKTTHSSERCYLGAKAQNKPPLRNRRQIQVQQKSI